MLRSKHGPEYCQIDCEGNGRGVVFNQQENAFSVLWGISILNGDVFEEDGEDNPAIWGSMTDLLPPPLEVDITKWVDPARTDFQGDHETRDTMFGIEGLCFRYEGNVVSTEVQFDGYIDFALELRKGERLLLPDQVRLKVAPWMMMSREQASEEI